MTPAFKIDLNIPDTATPAQRRAIELWMQAAQATMDVLASSKPDDPIINAVLDASMVSIAAVAAPMGLDRNQRKAASKKLEGLIVKQTQNFRNYMDAIAPRTVN